MQGSFRLGPEFFVSLVVLGLFAWLAYQRIPLTVKHYRADLPNLGTYHPDDQTDFQIVTLITRYADKTEYVFTDRPMYAFRSGAQVHPGLAVLTGKRYSTGDPTQEEILSILEEINPGQIIVGRFDIPAVREYMAERNFVRVDNSPRSRHHVRGDIFYDH
jgi:hypothetical protein